MRLNRSVLVAGFLASGMCLIPPTGLSNRIQAGIVIDRFMDPGDGTTFFAPGLAAMGPEYPSNTYTRQDSGSGILMGQGTRNLLLELVGDGPFPFNAAVGWMPAGQLDLATFGEEGARLSLTYQIDSGAMDLTAEGASMFVIRFLSLDPGFDDFLRLATTVTDSEGVQAVHAVDLAETTTAVGYELPFSEFVFDDPSGSPGGDPLDVLKDAQTIQFTFNAHDIPISNVDFSIVSISTIPEPAAAVLGLIGLAAVALFWSSRASRLTRRDPRYR